MLLVGEPCLGADERAVLAEVVDSGWITMGDRVRAFERAFAEAHRVPDAVAVNSCTAALHLALEALGIGRGDEVLVPSLSFVATANCVLYAGATPIFVDVDSLQKPLMSLSDAARKCTKRTRAVILMHYAGYIADADAWRSFADERRLRLVEDAAHAAGAPGAGTFGDAAAFSFYGNKNMTTAEGGMVFARDPAVVERMRQMRAHGMTRDTRQRHAARSASYDVTMLGWNYRMDEFRAAIGSVQLKSLRHWNERRACLTRAYRSALAESCPGVRVPFAEAGYHSSYHILPIVLPEGSNREDVTGRMRDAGIQTTVHYPPIHRMSFYRERFPSDRLPVTEEFARREMTLPLHPKLEGSDVGKVANALADALARQGVERR